MFHREQDRGPPLWFSWLLIRDACPILFLTCSDDSMGYQYPFTLRVVGKDGNSCAWCPWYRLEHLIGRRGSIFQMSSAEATHTPACVSRFCRGCTIECSEDRASVGNAYIAVDWDPTALHLRYQTSQERVRHPPPPTKESFQAQFGLGQILDGNGGVRGGGGSSVVSAAGRSWVEFKQKVVGCFVNPSWNKDLRTGLVMVFTI